MVVWINLPFSVDGISVDVDNSGCACARVRTVNGVIHNSYPHGVARCPRCPAGQVLACGGTFLGLPPCVLITIGRMTTVYMTTVRMIIWCITIL